MLKKEIKKFWDLISKSKKILLINHIRMDMDALWSLSAMYDILWQLWKDVKAVNDELPPENYNIVWYNHIIEPDLDIKLFNPDLIISFDAASEEQLGTVYKNNLEVFKNNHFVAIDHHVTNTWFWTLNLIAPWYSSTCELTYDILKELNLIKYITPEIALSLLSGIYTDTNIYYNSNTTSNTLRVAAELIDAGADFRKTYFEFYKKRAYPKSKLWWKVLSKKLKISKNRKIAWACVPKKFFKETWTTDRDLTGLISEFFANIEWIEISFLLYEQADKKIKTSLRSTEKHNVSKIASHLGWWWHKQAAWFTSKYSLKKTEKMILNELKKELE